MMKKKKKGFLACLLLVLALALSGCQTGAAQESAAASVLDGSSLQAATQQETEEETPEAAPEEEQEYIDEAYVDENYGDDGKEDLSKYESDTAENSISSSSQTTDGEAGASGNGSQNGASGSSEANADNYYTDPVPEGKPQPVEPQDEAVNTDQAMTCTLLVECSTILNNMGDLTEGKESLVPADGVIYGPSTVTFYEGESVYDVLLREMQNNRIHMESVFTAMYNSAYVEGINNLYEFDCGRWSGWMYCVNGWYPNYGCSRYQVQEGDVIEWHYTCDLGRDLGRDNSDWQQ